VCSRWSNDALIMQSPLRPPKKDAPFEGPASSLLLQPGSGPLFAIWHAGLCEVINNGLHLQALQLYCAFSTSSCDYHVPTM
jgi:hypothetical protein